MHTNRRHTKTILITGAAGYIGSILVPRLLEYGHRVIAVDRFFFGDHTLPYHPELVFIRQDTRCLEPNTLSGVDSVIDLAALSNDSSGEYFPELTWDINHEARFRTARLAQKLGVRRYVLPSSCSVYGFSTSIQHENSATNPLSHYAQANKAAEEDILPLASSEFSVTALRFATVYGYSPRMRLDLAINAMLYSGWSRGKIPVLRDGTQYRPFIHIQDAADAIVHFIELPENAVNGKIFNIGSADQTWQLGNLARTLSTWLKHNLKKNICLEWYGSPDNRSYQVNFNKCANHANWEPRYTLINAYSEMLTALRTGKLVKTPQTMTLEWYKYLQTTIPENITMHGGVLDLPNIHYENKAELP